jgi:hypothetical protein
MEFGPFGKIFALQWEYQSDSIICQQSGGCGTVLDLHYPYNNIVSDVRPRCTRLIVP